MNSSQDFSRTVDQFLRLQKRKRIVSETRDVTLMDLLEDMEPMSVEEVKDGFTTLMDELPEDAELLRQVKECFIDAVRSLNHLNPSRRFFALETFNYLGNIEHLTLTAETLIFAGDDAIRPIALNFISAFKGTDAVITTLTKHDELFEAKTKDSQMHALNAFRYDMAEKLLTLLKQDFVLAEAKAAKIESDLSLDLLRAIVNRNRPAAINPHLVSGRMLALQTAKLIAYIQGHRMMPIYAKKRSDFLKNFLIDLSTPGRVEGVQSVDMSRVAACFLYTNEQLRPPEGLIEKMISETAYDEPETDLFKREFMDQLAPTTIDASLKDIRDFLKLLADSPLHDIEATFEQARVKYEAGLRNDDTLLGRFHDAVMDLKVVGLEVVETLEEFVGKLKAGLTGPSKDRPQRPLDELFDEMPEVDDIEEYRVISKDSSFSERAEEYICVSTTEVGYRSAMSDGGKRGHAVNLQLFKNEENLKQFKEAFMVLIKTLADLPGHQVVTNEFKHPQASAQVTEFYGAYLIPMPGDDPMLFCAGIGYFEKDLNMLGGDRDAKDVADAYMDPYCFLMHVKNSETTMNARSRKLLTEDPGLKGLEFKAINLRSTAYAQACLSVLLDLLHLVDESDWESQPVQKLVDYLYTELKLKPEFY
ncbi:MAG: hypothetical protein RRB13_04705 [bacterium]|nr:hypothetical protein [bacterium]